MAALSHGVRQLRQRVAVPIQSSRSLHTPASAPRPSTSTAQRIFSDTRTFLSRLVFHFTSTPHLSPQARQPFTRPTQFSSSQSIHSRFSLPVRHALSRPFSAPRLPRPPALPANVAQVGLGTARAFHSARPIFQNMADNVPVATRALWEAEWDVKMKKKETRRMRRAAQNKAVQKSQEMLKPKPRLIVVEPPYDASELDVYFPVEPTPAVATHLLVPLAPTPTAQLPLSTRTQGNDLHPLLPISDLASIHTRHRLHSLRVSTLFARLDTANVWDDPGVNVDAYAFGSRSDTQEKQCTILRVTFRGWSISRVCAILGDSAEQWYSLEETCIDGRPTFVPPPEDIQVNMHSESPLPESIELDSGWASEGEVDNVSGVLSSPPLRASASAQHDLVLPTLDLSFAVSDAVDSVPPPAQPVIFLRTVSELAHGFQPEPSLPCGSTTSSLSPTADSCDQCLGLSSSFLQRVREHGQSEGALDM